ncbi:MAG: putative PEP-binding protein, partial [Planctomycetota bacterium]
LSEIADLPAITTDGVEIDIVGNIEFPDEIDRVVANGGLGVGLYRTEFLYLAKDSEPTEDDHYQAYADCVRRLAGRTLTIRTVDLGADKYTQERAMIPERNPFLGLRSIRYCLVNTPMFKRQLRAILRASALGPIKVMFPLVTTAGELRHARMLLRDVMEELDEERIEYDHDLKLGIMVEVPSAALTIDSLAREIDFVSIGTNDLVQYTLAVDRTNERVAGLYQPAHPAVLKLIREVVRAGRKADIEVSCCGEAAAQAEFALLFIGLGLRTLSVTSGAIPNVKRLVRAVSTTQAERVARKALTFDSETQAETYLRGWIKKLLPDAWGGIDDD